MSHLTRRPARGFTLIELLTVIAIIGILAAIIIPTVTNVQNTAKRFADGNNLRTIGGAAITYGQSNADGRLPDPKSSSSTARPLGSNGFMTWIGLLAKSGAMAEPKLYFSPIDIPHPFTDIPPSVLNDNKDHVAGAFESMTPAFEFVGGLRTSDPSTTPVGWTRGLMKSGYWDKATGTYADFGGHIVFLAGNMSLFTGSVENKLVNTLGKSTSNPTECIPSTGNQAIYGKNAIIGKESGAIPDRAK